jgi:hypothetical protein
MEVNHTRCGHTYFVKMYGQKYKDMLELDSCTDVGNCSVCWKLRRTPRGLAERAKYFVDTYKSVSEFMNANQGYFTYDDLQIEKIFNTWLNLETYENNFINE